VSRPPIILSVVLLLALQAAMPAGPDPSTSRPEPLLLDRSYPIEVGISFPAALLHWLDSLAGLNGPGMTAGKTVQAHREEYGDRFGRLTTEAAARLQRYAEIRWKVAERAGPERRNSLTLAFFETEDLDQALLRSRELLDDDEPEGLGEALDYFAPSYEQIWNDAAIPERFVRRAGKDANRRELSKFLVRMAEFFEVPADREPHPRVVLVPVPRGHGTHAQAIERNLLIEIRDWEGLTDEISPIVHENAHLLFSRIGSARRTEMEQLAASVDTRGSQAWQLLHEALPTALGQGVAGERFLGDRWSATGRWYHTDPVDLYAKDLFPLVRKSLGKGKRFDDAFLKKALSIYLENDRLAARPNPQSP
jgi:hypothetical protein